MHTSLYNIFIKNFIQRGEHTRKYKNPGPGEKSSLAIFVLDDPAGFDAWWPLAK